MAPGPPVDFIRFPGPGIDHLRRNRFAEKMTHLPSDLVDGKRALLDGPTHCDTQFFYDSE